MVIGDNASCQLHAYYQWLLVIMQAVNYMLITNGYSSTIVIGNNSSVITMWTTEYVA